MGKFEGGHILIPTVNYNDIRLDCLNFKLNSLRNKKKHDSKFKSAIQLVNTCSKLKVKALD